MDRAERERAALIANGTVPIAFDARCGGAQIRRNGVALTAGICYGCTLYGKQTGEHIVPLAEADTHGVWDCPNRRSGVHVAKVGDMQTAQVSPRVGGCE